MSLYGVQQKPASALAPWYIDNLKNLLAQDRLALVKEVIAYAKWVKRHCDVDVCQILLLILSLVLNTSASKRVHSDGPAFPHIYCIWSLKWANQQELV